MNPIHDSLCQRAPGDIQKKFQKRYPQALQIAWLKFTQEIFQQQIVLPFCSVTPTGNPDWQRVAESGYIPKLGLSLEPSLLIVPQQAHRPNESDV
ncbi:hypothetical protein CIB48_g8637 [Xylaria polymorpha]|nr:hypothetical protein CIB48_g8637 [Xylaria polymorpha]